MQVLTRHIALVAADRNSEGAWSGLISASAELWGDCWFTRQLVTLVPATVDLSLGASANLVSAAVRDQAAWVSSARESAGDSEWWRTQLPPLEQGLARRHWAFGILAIARTQVVQDLITEIGAVVDSLRNRHYQALREALVRHAGTGAGRTLNLRDPLRLRTFKTGPRTASLLTHCCVSDVRTYLDKIVVKGIIPFDSQDMIEHGVIPRHLKSADIKVTVTDLEGTRRIFTPGTLAAARALPSLTRAQANAVLEAPNRWPTEVVHLAAQKHGRRRAESLPPLANIADRDDWFQE